VPVFTETTAVADNPAKVAVIVDAPGAIPLTTPAATATAGELLLHAADALTSTLMPSEYSTDAISERVAPGATMEMAGVRKSAVAGATLTVKAVCPVTPPRVALIVVVP
jgi:hypothetical protein